MNALLVGRVHYWSVDAPFALLRVGVLAVPFACRTPMQNRAFSVVGPIVLSTLPWELYPFPRLCSHTFYGHQKIFCPSWSWECSCFRVVMDCSIQILMNE